MRRFKLDDPLSWAIGIAIVLAALVIGGGYGILA